MLHVNSNETIFKHQHTPGARFRACLHGGEVPQVGEVTRLGGVTRLSI